MPARDLHVVRWMIVLEGMACILVLLAAVPILSGLYQCALVGLSYFHTHLDETATFLPRVSVLIPAWNEGAVIGTTIDRLLALQYPADRLRIYVVDDASTDDTPNIVCRKAIQHPGQVFHIRRVAGGEGKAHTLNYGLEVLWSGRWTEAILIMDADVIYTPTSLLQMARHLHDPNVGAVTAYIKEGSSSRNYVQRYVTFEYITATGASRRAQNVMGFLACLSGGAQLHSRANLEAMGGKIFANTLAEDTFTTFNTQLGGRRALFEPNAIVYAEEPDGLVGLWKQRLRWARGNVQITRVFKDLWLRRRRHSGLGSPSMAIIWFSIFLMPVFQVASSLSLLGLWLGGSVWTWAVFRTFWIVAGLTYLIVTVQAVMIDPESASGSWREGILFPGVVSLLLILHALAPGAIPPLSALLEEPAPSPVVALIYAWLSLGMAVAWCAKWVEEKPGGKLLAPVLLTIGGYGSFLCAVTFASYIKELQGKAMVWDKTVKTGKVS